MSRKRAPGPYNYDDDEDYVPSKAVKYSEREDVGPQKVKKHSLDSDEEEDEDEAGGKGVDKNYDILKEEDIDGQEEKTLEFEGETQITPFNMKEEMEDGHFDGDGFYHFKKDATQIKDAWLDDIDWVKRLGGNKNKKISSAQKWKLKKTGSLGSENGNQDMTDFLKLTELANKIIETGNMDVYQETFEMINLKVERSKAPASGPALDMFAEGQDAKNDTSKENPDQQGQDCVEKVSWEIRWEDKEDAEVHGPFPNEKMLQWQDSGYFDKVAYVRRMSDKAGTWYSTKRIDFELYS
ncbi:CD2 antigen cytoplasmic tail-binding protein 2-like isoform X2 [Eriocheir sinensis]|uniref:CD2 antigen cytoplasmic tail-binding protein 2-like isoform X2 n=1 Tax=Eriocheir sinensis TaxID=95602 RepID=UPI0021C7E6C5|nr:CD2 antigen cytoplasmic tail-binding protein 2-like isoform X2 [Eriocheir sinensis]